MIHFKFAVKTYKSKKWQI